ncbi:MAG: flavodoxin family protein [Eubacteriales bacterium]
MKYAILYSSKTGNTKYLAEALYHKLKACGCTISESRNAEIPDADVYFVGFWACRGSCDPDTAELIKRLEGKRVFLFATAGLSSGGLFACGFFGSRYYRKILTNTCKIPENRIVPAGSFVCRGRMPRQTREKYEKMQGSPIKRIRAGLMLKNYRDSADHPNENDLEQFFSAVRKVFPEAEF